MPRAKKTDQRDAPYPWVRFWWIEWKNEATLRRLTHDERSRYLDVFTSTYGTATPGVMAEEDVRVWAGYSLKEWSAHRDAFAALFNLKRRRGMWVREHIVQDHAAGVRIGEKKREAGFAGAAARKARNEITSSAQAEDSSASNGASSAAAPLERCSTRREVDVDGEEKKTKDKTESRGSSSALRAGLAGTAGSSGPSPLAGVVRRALGKGLSEGRRA